MDEYKRHKSLWILLMPLVRLFLFIKLGFRRGEDPGIEGPCLILANHNSDYDMLMVGASFRRYMYFVGSEHMYRAGFASKLLRWAFNPIARMKGSTDGASALRVLREIKRGHSVCIFAEGNKSFDGLTNPIHPTIGKIVKSSRAKLVTYRMEGVYFCSPRWSDTVRRGAPRAVLQGVYEPDVLHAMTPDEIAALVRNDINEDAYAIQNVRRTRHRGKRLAEYLETALYICPVCGEKQSLKSFGDEISCRSCGMTAKYDEYGYLSGAPFETVTEWDAWQTERLRETVAAAGNSRIFSDSGMTLSLVLEDEKRTAASGEMYITREEFVLGDFTTPLEKITGISIIRASTLVFTVGDLNYEVRMGKGGCARKYLAVTEVMRNVEELTV